MTPAPSVPVREHRDPLTFPSLSTFPCLEQPAGTESPTSRCPQDLRLFARSSRVDVLRPGWAPFRCVLMHRSHGPWLPPAAFTPLTGGLAAPLPHRPARGALRSEEGTRREKGEQRPSMGNFAKSPLPLQGFNATGREAAGGL